MSRQELSEAINAWLWESTGKRYDLDVHLLAKWERGHVRWPSAHYRAALQAVLGAANDAELGFYTIGRRSYTVPIPTERSDQIDTPEDSSGSPPCDPDIWSQDLVTNKAVSLTHGDLTISRRHALTGASAIMIGSALTQPLQQWLTMRSPRFTQHRGSLEINPMDLNALEGLVQSFRSWTISGSGALTRKAVIAQLNELTEWLHEAPESPSTRRAFRIAAELADVAASISWDMSLHRAAQQYYVTSVQLAALAGDGALAASVLAALARQCYDLGQPTDGVEIIQLAQYGSRGFATPIFRSMLATREAWGYAQMGDVQAFRRAVGTAEDYFAEGTSGDDRPSVHDFDAAELAGVIGARYRDLALHDPHQAQHAVRYIEQALTQRRPELTRNRVFDLIGLARAYLIDRGPDGACKIINQVIPLAQPWVSGRVGKKLRDFYRESAQFDTVGIMHDTREAIRGLLVP